MKLEPVGASDVKYANSADILKQCMPGADPLLDNFRNDISCEVLDKFKARGLDLGKLLKFAEKVPVVYPWNDEYDRCRQNVNRRFVYFPWMIVMAKKDRHVTRALKFSTKYNIPLVTRSGSHSFEGYSLIDGMIIDQSQRKGMHLDGDVATVRSGVLIGPLQLYLSKYGYAFVGGTCPNTGLAGLSLGGGIGFLIRKYGLSCDNILQMDVALADGRIVTADKKSHPDLFWALCGAGNNNYGIVTKFKIRVYPIKRVLIYTLTYPFDQFSTIFDKWQHWSPHTHEDIGSELNIYKDRVVITGQMLTSPEAETILRRELEPFMADAKTVSIKTVPFIEAVRYFAGIGRWLPFFENKSNFATDYLPAQALTLISQYMTFAASPEDHVEFNSFGGKVAALPSDTNAFAHRNALFWMHFQCHWADQSDSESRIAWVTAFHDAIKPYISNAAYVNCPDSALVNYLTDYYGDHLYRLRQIKTDYDPDNKFNYPQSVPPLG